MNIEKILNKVKNSKTKANDQDDTIKENSNDNDIESTDDLNAQFAKFYQTCIEMLSKLQYRKILGYIEQGEDILSSLPDYWKIFHIKLICIQKIIEKKFTKYCNNSSTIPHIERWLKFYNAEISEWIDLLFDSTDIPNESNTIKIELTITILLDQCFVLAKYCFNQNFISDCAAFLSLGKRLIISTSDFFVSPESYHYCAKIYLFISSLLISNDCFISAKHFICIALKMCFKELELRIPDVSTLLFYKDLSQNLKEKVFLIFFYMTTGLYQLGVCYENEGNLERASHAFSQAKWFGKIIKNKRTVLFSDMLYDIEERLRIREDFISFCEKNINNFETVEEKEDIIPSELYKNMRKEKKLKELENYLDNIRIEEIDDEEGDLFNPVNKKPFTEKVGIATKNIHLLNYLMSDKFKETLYDMKNIEINNIDKTTKRIIQKKIIDIKNNERMKLINKEKKEKEKENYDNNKKKNKKRPLSSYSNYITLHSTKENTTINSFAAMPSEPNKQKNKKIIIKYNKDEIPKIKTSKFSFSRSFHKKLKYLDQQFSKEMKFQKEVFKCKSGEIYKDIEKYDERKVKEKCEDFFYSTLKSEQEKIKEKEKLLEEKEFSKKPVIKNRIKSAFSIKATDKFDKKTMRAYIMGPDTMTDKTNFNQINQRYLNTLQNDLDIIGKAENSISRRKLNKP